MCEISAVRPPQIDDTARATGLAYSTLGWKRPTGAADKGGQSLPAVLRESQKLPGFRAEKVTEHGREFLKIIAPQPAVEGPNGGAGTKEELIFWLDVGKGICAGARRNLAHRCEETVNTRRGKWTWRTSPTRCPNFFYPKHIELQRFGPAKEAEPHVVSRTIVDVSTVQMNAAVPEDTFSIEKVELPVGTSNLRGANGEVIRFTPDEQQRLIAQVARQVLAKAEREKAAATQSGHNR